MNKRKRDLVPENEKEELIHEFRRKNWIAPMAKEIQSRLEKLETERSESQPLVISEKEVENIMRDDGVPTSLLSWAIRSLDWTLLVDLLVAVKRSLLAAAARKKAEEKSKKVEAARKKAEEKWKEDQAARKEVEEERDALVCERVTSHFGTHVQCESGLFYFHRAEYVSFFHLLNGTFVVKPFNMDSSVFCASNNGNGNTQAFVKKANLMLGSQSKLLLHFSGTRAVDTDVSSHKPDVVLYWNQPRTGIAWGLVCGVVEFKSVAFKLDGSLNKHGRKALGTLFTRHHQIPFPYFFGAIADTERILFVRYSYVPSNVFSWCDSILKMFCLSKPLWLFNNNDDCGGFRGVDLLLSFCAHFDFSLLKTSLSPTWNNLTQYFFNNMNELWESSSLLLPLSRICELTRRGVRVDRFVFLLTHPTTPSVLKYWHPYDRYFYLQEKMVLEKLKDRAVGNVPRVLASFENVEDGFV